MQETEVAVADHRGTVGAPGAGHAIRVLIVDDHELVREGTRQLLERDGGIEVIATAGSAEEALELIDRLIPEVALVDVNLPAMSGLELAARVVASHPTVRVLILSAYDEHAYIAEALEIGVAGYLLKTASAKELTDAVRAVFEGVFVLDRQVSKQLVRRHETTPHTIGILTPRETAVLELLAQGRTNKQIAAELELGIRTVEGYVSNVLSKLGVSSRTEAATHALIHRLITSPDHVIRHP
ncbi:MAG TPA: response regulator transcription factor [Acidimicrobiales bacterium]|nr:response regulator transcription factor [Acidimicrobiales bacterium]